jgi:hypothetical protein
MVGGKKELLEKLGRNDPCPAMPAHRGYSGRGQWLGWVAVIASSATLASCERIDTVKGAFAHSEAVSADLQRSLGLKPLVGFNWNNGSLTSVNVTFPGIPPNASLSEIVDKSRQAIRDEFKEKPQRIIVGFNVEP